MRPFRKGTASIAFVSVFLFAASAQPARAAMVTFTTTGVFSTSGTNVLDELGDQTITFTGVTETVDTSDPGWFGSFGTFEVTTDGNAATGGLNSETFTLTITQVAPPGDTQFSAAMFGTINKNTSNATLTFTSPLTKEIAGFFYTVTTQVVNLPAPTASVSVGGHVIEQASTNQPPPDARVPEPATLLLLGIGGFAVAGLRRPKLR